MVASNATSDTRPSGILERAYLPVESVLSAMARLPLRLDVVRMILLPSWR